MINKKDTFIYINKQGIITSVIGGLIFCGNRKFSIYQEEEELVHKSSPIGRVTYNVFYRSTPPLWNLLQWWRIIKEIRRFAPYSKTWRNKRTV